MAMKMLYTDLERCTGCRLCEIACSLEHGGIVNPASARIQVLKFVDHGFDVPTICLQCQVPMCAHACQPEAISRSTETGAMIIDYDRCIGCRMCMMACPFGAISIEPNTQKVVKCDLCGGDPRCTKVCETHAVDYLSPEEFMMRKKRKSAATLHESLLGASQEGVTKWEF